MTAPTHDISRDLVHSGRQASSHERLYLPTHALARVIEVARVIQPSGQSADPPSDLAARGTPANLTTQRG